MLAGIQYPNVINLTLHLGSWKCLWSGDSLKRQERRRVRTRRSHKEMKKKKPADGRRGASFCFQRHG
ncbi:Laminin subunit gamma-1 [Dissostichus eleginoides]|nr:Laminin subunit gamma-1 [Dissostichus eleginoides]